MQDKQEILPPSLAANATAPLTVKEAFQRVFPSVMIAMFLAAADQTILASALPAIARSLGSFANLSWVVVAYLLAAAVAAPLYGRLGDRFGRRRMLILALSVFMLASLGCAVAPTLPALIAARAVQGLGGGGLMTLAQALIGENVSPRDRGRFAGYFATVFALSSTAAPVLGAYLTEHLSWRAVFAINLPLGVIAIVLARRIPPVAFVHLKRYAPDIVGALLFSLSTIAFLYGFSSIGHRFAFASWQSLLLIAGGGIGYWLFFFWESRVTDPLIPLHVLKAPVIVRSDAVVICFAAALFPTILYLPLYLQLGRGIEIGESGLLLLPLTLAIVLGSTMTGKCIAHTGSVTPFPRIGLTLATLALLILAITLRDIPTWAVMILMAFAGVGLGTVMPSTQVTVQAAAGPKLLGVATASISVSRAIGGAFGVALVGAVLATLVGKAETGATTALTQILEGSQHHFTEVPSTRFAAATGQFDEIFGVVFLVIAFLTGLGALVACTIPTQKL